MSTTPANHSALTPLRFLERSAEVFPDKTAILHGERSYTYAQFADETQALAAALARDVAPGERVAVLTPNVPESIFAHFAAPLAKTVLVALNTRLTRPEIAQILNHCQARVLLVDSELVERIEGIRELVPGLAKVIEVNDSESRHAPSGSAEVTGDYASYVAAGVSEPLPWAVDDEQGVISINYTSGTTGTPKGVMYSHRGAYLASLGSVVHNQFTPESKYLWTLPMFHCNGWCTAWAVTAAGGTQICLREVRAEAVWHAIDDLGTSHICGAPAVCTTIAGAEQAHPLDRPLRITTAGAPPAPTVIAALEEIGIHVVHVYGLTESYGPFTICEHQEGWPTLPAAERANLLSRQGVGMVQAERARVVDLDMNDVPADGETLGEIVLRGNNIMLGYFRNPDATEEAFHGGWFHTGDLGVMHPDGYVQVRDRAKDIVISGGENISTVEVEQALLRHPQIVDVAVVGVPDEKWGERPRAFVITEPGATLTVDDVVAHAREWIAGYKVPRDIVFADGLPRTSTGKVMKHELRKA
ncbi:AMP-binding protein [Nocardioides jishulii]|uniref:Acyl-CoA synthetase n=1 Tax=Nocardioides jishulii TaxID=2575440 RepID=A0A4U2YRZ2_9ACTN|nr:AMP-binding protein [Nocardioides jishulii]QCX26315.1 AMP-binding protein [Nocardioides jishulii]TKI63880.1 acyl-CoA synthetase [Nocardioides jishulii]